MKKILLGVLALFLIVGCGNMMDTPTKKVESFLNKYQTTHADVLAQLDEVIDSAGTMTKDQKEAYRDLMEKQYKNLSYKIKDEIEDGDTATVEVEIEAYDYATSIKESETYLTTNKSEFLQENTTDEDVTDEIIDEEKFMTYKLDQLKDVKDKIKYTINFTLTKEDGNWKLDDITDIDRQKLHGLYY